MTSDTPLPQVDFRTEPAQYRHWRLASTGRWPR